LRDGATALYATASDGRVRTTVAQGGSWQQVSTDGTTFVGTPAVLQSEDGVVNLFVRTIDGEVLGTSQSAAGFRPWTTLGTRTVVSDPVGLLRGDGAMVVYATAGDGNIWSNDKAGSWQRLTAEGTFVGNPAVVPTPVGGVDLFARTADGQIRTATQPGPRAPFGPWGYVALGDGRKNDPRVNRVTGAADGTVVYCSETDGNVWTSVRTSPGGPWRDWRSVAPAGRLMGSPTVLALPQGDTAVFARTTGGRVMGTSQPTAAGPYDPWNFVAAGGGIITDPKAVIAADGLLELYVTATDGRVWTTRQTGRGAGSAAGWAEWRQL